MVEERSVSFSGEAPKSTCPPFAIKDSFSAAMRWIQISVCYSNADLQESRRSGCWSWRNGRLSGGSKNKLDNQLQGSFTLPGSEENSRRLEDALITHYTKYCRIQSSRKASRTRENERWEKDWVFCDILRAEKRGRGTNWFRSEVPNTPVLK